MESEFFEIHAPDLCTGRIIMPPFVETVIDKLYNDCMHYTITNTINDEKKIYPVEHVEMQEIGTKLLGQYLMRELYKYEKFGEKIKRLSSLKARFGSLLEMEKEKFPDVITPQIDKERYEKFCEMNEWKWRFNEHAKKDAEWRKDQYETYKKSVIKFWKTLDKTTTKNFNNFKTEMENARNNTVPHVFNVLEMCKSRGDNTSELETHVNRLNKLWEKLQPLLHHNAIAYICSNHSDITDVRAYLHFPKTFLHLA